jgi:hypothetical protein
MVCIEVDFSKELKCKVHIQNIEEIIYQLVVYSKPIPCYCQCCEKFGHEKADYSNNPHQLRKPVADNLSKHSPTVNACFFLHSMPIERDF